MTPLVVEHPGATPRRGRIRAFAWVLMAAMAGLLLAEAARAEPYIAVRTGYKCSQCHVNKTGGSKRTEFGVIYSQTHLYLTRLGRESGYVDPRLRDMISVGANVRVRNRTRPDETSSTGETREGEVQSRLTEANVYLQVDLVPNQYSIVLDQTVAPTGTNRELYMLVQNRSQSVYAKAGRMLLPYGLRILDDEAFIRLRTGYNYNRHDLGFEVGVEPGSLSASVNVTDTRLSAVASTVHRRWRLGGSLGRITTRSGSRAYGVFAGTTFGKFTLLGEGNAITEGQVDQFAGFLEANVLLVRGFNAKVTYEFFDRNRDVDNDLDAQDRITIGVEPFITPFTQIGVFYRINRSIPQNAAENQDQFEIELHGFF